MVRLGGSGSGVLIPVRRSTTSERHSSPDKPAPGTGQRAGIGYRILSRTPADIFDQGDWCADRCEPVGIKPHCEQKTRLFARPDVRWSGTAAMFLRQNLPNAGFQRVHDNFALRCVIRREQNGVPAGQNRGSNEVSCVNNEGLREFRLWRKRASRLRPGSIRWCHRFPNLEWGR